MINIIPNQALAELAQDNGCGGVYVQPVKRGDVFSIQGYASVIGANRAIVGNPSGGDYSWTLSGAGFTQVGTTFVHVGYFPGATSTATSFAIGMQKNRAYLLGITITVSDIGDCIDGQGVLIKINNEFVKLPDVTLGQGSRNTFTLYGYYVPAAITTDTIVISTNNTTISFIASAITLKELSYPAMDAYKNGGFVAQLDPIYLKYYRDNAIENQSIRWEMKFGLDALADSCYSLKLREAFGNVLNSNFNSASEWTLGTGWTVSGGAARFTGTPTTEVISAKFESIGGVTHVVKLDNPSAVLMTVTFADASTFSYNFYTFGTSEIEFDAPAGVNGLATIVFQPFSGGGPVAVVIDSVIITTPDLDISPELMPVSLNTNLSGTLLLSATNNDSAFDFDYSAGFTQTLRITAKMDVTAYPEDADTYVFSDNSEALLFGRTQKEYSVFVTDAPVYIHDCLRMLRLNDVFTIDGAEKVRSGTYELNRRKTSELKQSTFTVKDAEGISSNYRLS